MSEDNSSRLIYLDTVKSQIIPVPAELTEREGFKEIGRIWRKAGDGENRERFVALLRTTYPEPVGWVSPIAAMVRTLASLYTGDKLDKMDQDKFALSMLYDTIRCIFNDHPELAIEAGLFQPAPLEPENSAPVEVQGPAPVATPAPQKEIIGVESDDQRQIPLPPALIEDPEAQHLFTVWPLPDEPDCDDCPECGSDHDGPTFIGTNTLKTKDRVLGKMLGLIAMLHAQVKTDDEIEQMKIIGNVQKHFHDYLNKGLPRA